MRLSGFSIVRNGVQFDYPFIEAISSILPICDEFVLNVGISDDDTLKKVHAFIATLSQSEQKKFVIFESEWPLNDPEKRKGGKILSEQTNLALEKCRGRWCFYIQADEVVHEDDLKIITNAIDSVEKEQSEVEALVFNYVHFYATYDVIQTGRSAYRREMRVIKNSKSIRSVGDAQSFRHQDQSKLKAVLIPARIFHYGWVKHQEVMKAKTGFMDTLYHPASDQAAPATGENYLYKRFVGLKKFNATHPKVMLGRVSHAVSFDFSKAPRIFELKDIWKILSGWIEALTGVRLFEFRNYRLVKKL